MMNGQIEAALPQPFTFHSEMQSTLHAQRTTQRQHAAEHESEQSDDSQKRASKGKERAQKCEQQSVLSRQRIQMNSIE